jgi:GNAT superfamily N-acetyltransferase
VLETVYAGLRHFVPMVAGGSEGAHLIDRDGVLAAVIPVAPERSVLNSVTYEHADGLRDAYEEVAAAYDAVGANWTVWVRTGDADAAALLTERGHVLDAEPEAMGRSLANPPERPNLEIEWTDRGSMKDVATLNDLAYGYGDGSFAKALTGTSLDHGAIYVARAGGEPVGCLVMNDDGPNSDVEWVAVAPEARGRGLSGRLLALGLRDAFERGCETSTLVSTKLGRPVYDRLGFEALGTIQMWERRRAAAT